MPFLGYNVWQWCILTFFLTFRTKIWGWILNIETEEHQTMEVCIRTYHTCKLAYIGLMFEESLIKLAASRQWINGNNKIIFLPVSSDINEVDTFDPKEANPGVLPSQAT